MKSETYSKELSVKWKVIGYISVNIYSLEADLVIEDNIYDLVSGIIVSNVSSSVENFIENFVDQADTEDDPLFLVPLSSSKRLLISESILKELE